MDASTYHRSLQLPYGSATVVAHSPTGSHRRVAAARGPPGPSGRGRAVPPTPRSRCRPGRRRAASSSSDRLLAAARAQASGPPRARTRRRLRAAWCARSSASRCRSPVPARCSAGSRRLWARRWLLRSATSPCTSPRRSRWRTRRRSALPMPKARAATVQRVAEAVAAGDLVIGPGVERAELARPSARAPRHRSLDRRLRRASGARRSRRLPADGPRCASRAGAPGRTGGPAARGGAGRSVATVAVVRVAAPLDEPVELNAARTLLRPARDAVLADWVR